MGKKKAFINKKNATTFKLVPGTHVPEQEGSSFKPTKEHLEEQHKYGIYFDDDYDYMKHLKDAKDGYELKAVKKAGQSAEEEEVIESVVIRAPAFPFPFSASSQNKKVNFFDTDLEKALEGDFGEVEGDLDDNFIEIAGGALPDGVSMMYRAPRRDIIDSDEEEEEEDWEDDEFDQDEFGDEEMEEEVAPSRKGMGREFDDNFEKFLETDYTEDQVGELDGEDEQIGGAIEPDSERLKKLAGEAPKLPEYDEKLAKDYVRKRMALIEAGVIKETEQEVYVEVDESCSKRMKWDCESFASQYTNIYNHPTMIKDPNSRLSRKALKRLERESTKISIAENEDDEEMEASDDEISTVSTFRPKDETPEQRKLRKQAVKEARRVRRVEKKANKVAFGEEFRKAIKSRVGQVNGKVLA